MKRLLLFVVAAFLCVFAFCNEIKVDVNSSKGNKTKRWIFVLNYTSKAIPYEAFGQKVDGESVFLDKGIFVPNTASKGVYNCQLLPNDFINEYDSFKSVSLKLDGEATKSSFEFKSGDLYITIERFKFDSEKEPCAASYDERKNVMIFSRPLDSEKDNADIVFSWLKANQDFVKKVKRVSPNKFEFDVQGFSTKGGMSAWFFKGADGQISLSEENDKLVFTVETKHFYYSSYASKVARELFDALDSEE